jgi:hypothetical protein
VPLDELRRHVAGASVSRESPPAASRTPLFLRASVPPWFTWNREVM